MYVFLFEGSDGRAYVRVTPDFNTVPSIWRWFLHPGIQDEVDTKGLYVGNVPDTDRKLVILKEGEWNY